jgi:hypothetical protein
LREKIWLTGGWNYLRPDSDRSAGDYLIKYGVIGLRYSKDGFQNMVYANVKFNDGAWQMTRNWITSTPSVFVGSSGK